MCFIVLCQAFFQFEKIPKASVLTYWLFKGLVCLSDQRIHRISFLLIQLHSVFSLPRHLVRLRSRFIRAVDWTDGSVVIAWWDLGRSICHDSSLFLLNTISPTEQTSSSGLKALIPKERVVFLLSHSATIWIWTPLWYRSPDRKHL